MLKPILFNTEMVRAILNDRKTETRRTIKEDIPRDAMFGYSAFTPEGRISARGYIGDEYGEKFIKLPYQPGDILYVRETWIDWGCEYCDKECFGNCNPPNYAYRATGDWDDWEGIKWKPSIHMPKEAARIFLKVSEVKVEQLKDMKLQDFLNEGIQLRFPNVIDRFTEDIAKGQFIELWNNAYPKQGFDYGNPYVWVIKFERCTEEGEDV